MLYALLFDISLQQLSMLYMHVYIFPFFFYIHIIYFLIEIWLMYSILFVSVLLHRDLTLHIIWILFILYWILYWILYTELYYTEYYYIILYNYIIIIYNIIIYNIIILYWILLYYTEYLQYSYCKSSNHLSPYKSIIIL